MVLTELLFYCFMWHRS